MATLPIGTKSSIAPKPYSVTYPSLSRRKTSIQERSFSHSHIHTKTRFSSRSIPTVAMAGKKDPLRVMIAGAPAAGKGTQCARIVDKYGLVHISVGDLLRAEVAAETPAGLKAKAYMDAGDLVPNDVVVEMVKGKLTEETAVKKGWLLDGYPRSGDQAEAIEAEGIRPDVFLLINVPDDMLVARVVGRRSDPETGEIYHLTFKPPPPEVPLERLVQRSDDTEDKVRNRLDTYHKNVDAVLGYYKDVTVEIDGTGSMDAVFESVCQAIDGVSTKKKKSPAAKKSKIASVGADGSVLFKF